MGGIHIRRMTGPEFKLALRGLGVTQRVFAAATGINVHTINRWAVGALPVPRYAEYIVELLQDQHVDWREAG